MPLCFGVASCQQKKWSLSAPFILCDNVSDCLFRLGDADPCCGVASMQKFTGEDLAVEHRRTQQITANKQAWDAQLQAHLAEAAAASAAEKVAQEKVGSLGDLTCFVNRMSLALLAAQSLCMCAGWQPVQWQITVYCSDNPLIEMLPSLTKERSSWA